MRKRVICAALCLVLFLGGQVYAVGNVDIQVNGATPAGEIITELYAQNTYVSYWPIVVALRPDATATWVEDHAAVRAEGLELNIRPGAHYLEVNGRCLYVPGGIVAQGDTLLLPARVLAQALGAAVEWDGANRRVQFVSGAAPLTPGAAFYREDDIYWLSRIIYAESGNQSLEGKIAVGEVILNRVASGAFPNTIYEVIFQPNQFSPVGNGSINRTPNAESVRAAKLVLEGASVADESLYFVNPNLSPNCWAVRNRTRVATIGAHAFFE